MKMSELAAEIQTKPLDEMTTGEQQEEQKEVAALRTESAVELSLPIAEQIASVSINDEGLEGSIPADKDSQTKMQSVLQQVRKQIRSQVGMNAPKNSMLDLVQRVHERAKEMVNREPDCNQSCDEENGEEVLTNKSIGELATKEEELSAIFEKELEASKKALRDEFTKQISQLRKEMQAYTDQALKDVEGKVQSWLANSIQRVHHKEQLENKGSDKKQKSSIAPSLVSKRARTLTRTMTTITPKTCAPVIIGPRAKSENLSSSKHQNSSLLLLRDPDFCVYTSPGSRHQSHRPLPPACPPLHLRQKSVRTKTQAGN